MLNVVVANVTPQAPTILEPLEDVHVAEGSDAVLTCCICGRPTVTFDWSRAGAPVDSGRVSYDELTGNLRLEVSRHLYTLSNARSWFFLVIFGNNSGDARPQN